MIPPRATFADTPASLEAERRRRDACSGALSRYALFGIENGAVCRTINAAIRLTAAVERAEEAPASRMAWARVRGASREVLAAAAELQQRGSVEGRTAHGRVEGGNVARGERRRAKREEGKG